MKKGREISNVKRKNGKCKKWNGNREAEEREILYSLFKNRKDNKLNIKKMYNQDYQLVKKKWSKTPALRDVPFVLRFPYFFLPAVSSEAYFFLPQSLFFLLFSSPVHSKTPASWLSTSANCLQFPLYAALFTCGSHTFLYFQLTYIIYICTPNGKTTIISYVQ